MYPISRSKTKTESRNTTKFPYLKKGQSRSPTRIQFNRNTKLINRTLIKSDQVLNQSVLKFDERKLFSLSKSFTKSFSSQSYLDPNSISSSTLVFNSFNDSDYFRVIPRMPYLVEQDNHYKNGRKLTMRGKDFRQLNDYLFDSISTMPVTTLDLSPDYQSCLNYKIDRVPNNINKLVHLRELTLDTNDLTELPQSFGELKLLERLSISNNRLKKLPESFSKLKNLKSLHMAKNLFEEIPHCIFLLDSLTFLDATSNFIVTVDKNISKLKNMKTLILYGNMITDIDGWIAGLIGLEVLWLGKNHIECLPLSITNIKTLDWKNKYLSVILEGNPLNKPPLKICIGGFDSIKKWYSNIKNGETTKS